MVAGQRRVFIYGQFLDAGARGRRRLLAPPPTRASVAIEILREFSALEFIGKIYVLARDGNWQPVTPLGVSQFDWFEKYQDANKKKQQFYFETQERDFWKVLYMRQESDEVGTYMAVALKHE